MILGESMGNITTSVENPAVTQDKRTRIRTVQISTLEKLFSFKIDPYELLLEGPAIVPCPSGPMLMYHNETHHVEELAAYLRGEEYSADDIMRLMQDWPREGEVKDSITERKVESFFIRCTDGIFQASTAMLRRRFQLIDDFITDTGYTSIVLAYTLAEVEGAIIGDQYTPLSQCYNCLLYLNPKSNLYPFYHDMSGMTMEQVSYLASKITPSERDELLLTLNRHTHLHLPFHNNLMLLVNFPSFRRAGHFSSVFFESYPSFFFVIQRDLEYRRGANARIFLDWFLAADFTRDVTTLSYPPQTIIAHLIDSIIWVLSEIYVTDKELGYLLAVLGVRHDSLKNTEMEVLLPYDILPPFVPSKCVEEIVSNLIRARPSNSLPMPINQVAFALGPLRG